MRLRTEDLDRSPVRTSAGATHTILHALHRQESANRTRIERSEEDDPERVKWLEYLKWRRETCPDCR